MKVFSYLAHSAVADHHQRDFADPVRASWLFDSSLVGTAHLEISRFWFCFLHCKVESL